ncbi:MAG: hypothetical protein PVI03_00865, partial [Candidatus Thorarchaeota archaeon]
MREKLPNKTLSIMLGTTGALAVLVVFMMGTVLADQTLKTVEVPVGYVALPTSAGSPYITTINVQPPDRIDDVISFELVMRGDFQASTQVVAKIRKTGTGTLFDCTPTSWTTPSIDTANYELSFDCTSLANQFNFTGGNIDVGFSVDKTAQNVYSRARMTYYNIPIGDVGVMGTEYEIDDRGTIFLQLKDTQGLPVNDGACYMDVYYPNQPNATHDALLTNAPLVYLNGSDGLYYYDLNMPNVTGVYMISASCSYTFQQFWIYPSDSTTGSNRSVYIGAYTGNTVVLNNPNDYLYTACTSGVGSGGMKYCQANYTWNISSFGINQSAITSIFYHYLGETSASADLNMSAWNYTSGSWYELPNWMTFSGLASSGYPTGINDYLGNSIVDSPLDFISSGGEIKLRLTSVKLQNFDQYDNWLALAIQTESGVIIDVKGSGELHVEDHFTNLTNFINGSFNNLTNLTAQEVWNYPNRNLTYINFTEVIDRIDTLEVYLAGNFTEILGYLSVINGTVHITNDTVYDIWGFQVNELSNNLTEIQAYLQDINDTANQTYEWVTGMVNLSAYDVWNFDSKNLTYFNYTPIYNRLDQMNVTIHTKLDQMLANLSSVNSSLYQAIVDSNSSIIARVDAHNGTIMTKLYGLQTEISDMNTSLWGAIVDANASIIAEIALTNSSLYNALVDANTSIIGRLDAHNGTIMSELYLIRQDIQDLNVSNQDRYNVLNATIMNELYSMNGTLQQIIQDINDTNSS